MSYPPDWSVTPGTSELADQFDDYYYRTSRARAHFVYVSRDAAGAAPVDLTATVAGVKADLKREYRAKLLTDKKISLGSYSGRIMTFTGVEGPRKLYIQAIVIKRGRVAYFIDMHSDTGTEADDRKLFYRMYKSFKPTS